MIIRSLLISMGMLIFAVGSVLFFLPGPFGLPTMAIGLTIMLKASDKVKRLTLRLVHRYPYSSRLWRKIRLKLKYFRQP